MDIRTLLKGKNCSCGKAHFCDIKDVVIGPGVITQVSDYTANYKNILLVCDKNTYKVCGKQVHGLIADKTENVIVFDDALLIPNEVAVDKVSSLITDKTDLIIGVGSGVIQDLCKYVSFTNNLKYHIVATAPSMDGYASVGAAMIMNNMKVTYSAHVPEVIIGDTDILKNAPIEMIKSGYGDILGKYSCLNDWKLSHVVNGEYFCDYVYDLTYDMLLKTKDLGERLLLRDENAIKILMEALIGVGIAMAYVGTSRPASGSEHHLSHFFEIIGIVKNEEYFMHGTDVAFSAVYTQKLREKLLKVTSPVKQIPFDREKWEADIKEVYLSSADGVINLQDKLGFYTTSREDSYNKNWSEIQRILAEAPSADEMIKYLESAGLDIADFEKLYGKEKINNALKYAKDLKDRYSVLWLYYDLFNVGCCL